ncbi:LysE/ArgO family amino acid transporter [Litorihabitans aurantiacus]|uniref:Amino acid transporter n=1 Tax=Litorihabitans aurantiacus TaxID=1930061 RepID=A0AA38CVF7_9MICO|nr:LysE/ArgO family amino acid transporter [Litorihabitans aurantiacus]GMA32875.1 amino acid transporter [Litorihabitans aurantiacus]
MITTALSGLAFGLGLIIAIGAQNAFVLRQGLRREHVGLVVAICAASDAVLIALGAAGVGAVVQSHRGVLVGVTIAGAAVLLVYGFGAARRALRPQALVADGEGAGRAGRAGRRGVSLTALALTWLNPHVYLDTVVLLGTVAAASSAPWAFAGGAVVASVAWFAALGFGARLLRPVFARPTAWRVLDVGVAVVMVAIALSLLLGLRGGH